jgi:hypothetical protein
MSLTLTVFRSVPDLRVGKLLIGKLPIDRLDSLIDIVLGVHDLHRIRMRGPFRAHRVPIQLALKELPLRLQLSLFLLEPITFRRAACQSQDEDRGPSGEPMHIGLE